jgi:hypothetical protein
MVMADDWMDKHFALEKAWHEEAKKYPNFSFPASMGIRKAKMDIDWWKQSGLHSGQDKVKIQKFVVEANKLISGKKFARGMDVPRGINIEALYYKIVLGYTDKQYSEHLMSYD